MSKQNTQQVTTLLPVSGDEASTQINLIKKYIYHWPLFLIGVVLALLGANYYLKTAIPAYPILATLEFDANTASSASLTVNSGTSQQELNPIDKPVIVENEIEVMQSKKLVYEVVNALKLWVTYKQKVGFKNLDLYKRSPVDFQFLHEEGNLSQAVKLAILIKDNHSFVCTDDSGGKKTYRYSTPINSFFGTWQLNLNPNFRKFIGKTISVTVQDPDQVSDSYKSKIKVALENKDAPFVNLSTSDESPQRGKDVLNSLMALYLKFAKEDKNKLSQNTLKFIDFRLDSLKTELDSIEKKIEIYKSTHNITNIDLQAQGNRDINQDNLKALNSVDLQLSIVSGLENYINNDGNSGKIPSTSGLIADEGLTSIYIKLQELQLQRERLLSTTPAANPLFITIDKQINSLKSDFKEKLSTIKVSLLAQKKQLVSFGNNVNSLLKVVPGEDREFTALQRVQESKEAIYKFLLEKHEQVALRYASSVSDSEVVDDAHASKSSWPIPSAVYAIALVAGCGIVAVYLFLKESLVDSISNRKQIENGTDVPILAELAFQETEEQIVITGGRGRFAIGEQFRVLRTNLFHLHGNNDSGRVTLFTSSVSGEGKSFVSSNLAVTLAYASRKTIILEMDLRKPKISINYGLSSDFPGISNYLNGTVVNINELIRPSNIPNLDVLSCGAILPNPSELLETNKLDELIDYLKGIYDEIIIDSPPIHLVTDALIIGRVTDATLYVIRQDYTHKHELEFVSSLYESNRFPKLALVYNGVKGGGSGYGYGYGYGQYGYNNSYNSYANKTKVTFGDMVKDFMQRF